VRATKFVAHLPIRTRGTIGGSIANADPAAEYPAVLLALGATIVVRGAHGERRIAADDFFLGLFTTALKRGELVVEIRFPIAKAGQFFGFSEYSRRPGDLALVGVAAAVTVRDDWIFDARMVIFGVAKGAQRMSGIEDALRGRVVSASIIEQAARGADEIQTQTDLHATGEMRKELALTLTKQALREALGLEGAGAR
jgi:carbon-monoxide dehydrogenase medium subunit